MRGKAVRYIPAGGLLLPALANAHPGEHGMLSPLQLAAHNADWTLLLGVAGLVALTLFIRHRPPVRKPVRIRTRKR